MNDISFNFAPAVRTNTAIILALAGASGSGKTLSALLLAAGLCGDEVRAGDILLIDSEGDRGLHYAPSPDQSPDFESTFLFSHYSWRPPYTPASLRILLDAAVQHKFKVVIIDSMSDEFEGDGGLCDMKEAAVQDWRKKKNWGEVNDAACWAKPKAEHKAKIVRWLRGARCHVIFCLRADEKIEFQEVVKDGRKKTVVVPKGWIPIAEKRLLFDVTTSLLFTPDQPGVPKPIKLYDKHAQFFPSDKRVSRQAGQALAAWAAGGKPVKPPAPDPEPTAEVAVSAPAVARRPPGPPKDTAQFVITGGNSDITLPTVEEWQTRWLGMIPQLNHAAAEKLYDRNAPLFDEYSGDKANLMAVREVINALQQRYR